MTSSKPTQPVATSSHEEGGLGAQLAATTLVAFSPTLCQVLAFITNSRQFDGGAVGENCSADGGGGAAAHGATYNRSLSGFAQLYSEKYLSQPGWGASAFYGDMLSEAMEDVPAAVTFLVGFNFLALMLYWWRGSVADIQYGPITPKGARPDYIDNGVAHSILFTLVFIGLSDFTTVFGLDEYFSTAGWFALSIMFDRFQGIVLSLNVFGLLFCVFLYFKGLLAPSGPDNGSSGNGVIFDYYWGMEL